jgi:4-aminobutyrate aminotransferase/(S)-3-amino-2-methylpropionate transaminase
MSDVWATLHRHEPAALHAQAPVVWARATGTRVTDDAGRTYLDWTSGVLTANAGHAPPTVVAAIIEQAQAGLLHAYAFPTRVRAQVLARLAELTGFPHAVLLTTGTEAVEVAIKLTRSRRRDTDAYTVISFDGAFHGRTMGAQLAGGLAYQRHWVGEGGSGFVRCAYPSEDWTTRDLDAALDAHGLTPDRVACVLIEPYQGSTLRVLHRDAAKDLREWCTRHGVALILDEIQSGFGRTGTLFAHEQLGVRPDLLLCGKGISGSLPVSAVLYTDPGLAAGLRPGELTSTHAANPVALAAVRATLDLYADGTLVAAGARAATRLTGGLATLAARHPVTVGDPMTWGMVAGFTVTDSTGTADPAAARELVARCVDGGLLLFAPIGPTGALMKIAPPLVITGTEIDDGFTVLDRALTGACP